LRAPVRPVGFRRRRRGYGSAIGRSAPYPAGGRVGMDQPFDEPFGYAGTGNGRARARRRMSGAWVRRGDKIIVLGA
jgi:hypothetical protein